MGSLCALECKRSRNRHRLLELRRFRRLLGAFVFFMAVSMHGCQPRPDDLRLSVSTFPLMLRWLSFKARSTAAVRASCCSNEGAAAASRLEALLLSLFIFAVSSSAAISSDHCWLLCGVVTPVSCWLVESSVSLDVSVLNAFRAFARVRGVKVAATGLRRDPCGQRLESPKSTVLQLNLPLACAWEKPFLSC